jgi:ribA/ribD-fused uncharacterized protein
MYNTTEKYNISESIVFASTKGEYGGLSNMAAGFSLFVNEINIANTEALYQACKFPLFPTIQNLIIEAKSPMVAKEISRKYNEYVRQDWHWEDTKYKIMEWCLRVKLLQNYATFSQLLLSTEKKTIVEYSQKDTIWGAINDNKGYLVGVNALGKLLIKLRDELQPDNPPTKLLAPNISGFLLYNRPISTVYTPDYYFEDNSLQSA